jgi:hypothetical protein
MRAIERFSTIACLVVSTCVGVARADAEFTTIQAAINAAESGDVVSIPAGIYSESIAIKDGVVLCGEGANTTIIDGGGANIVVTCGKSSAIMGFTIQNGTLGVYNAGNFIGVSDCVIKDISRTCVRLSHGSALISHNLLQGSGNRSSGVVSYQSNPVTSDNVIVNHQWTGVLGTQNHVLSISGNVIAGNKTGVRCMNGSEAIMDGNTFDSNTNNVRSVELSDTDTIAVVDLTNAVPYRQSPPIDEILAEMADVYEIVVAEHPLLIYTLSDELGTFNMATFNTWATFTVSASAPDTAIDAYAAHDLVELVQIDASYEDEPSPRVVVKNVTLREKQMDRYALTATYFHPDSYAAGADGQIVFSRLASFTNIRINVPVGYDVVSVNQPHSVSVEDGRTTVEIVDMGHTDINLVMAPSNP